MGLSSGNTHKAMVALGLFRFPRFEFPDPSGSSFEDEMRGALSTKPIVPNDRLVFRELFVGCDPGKSDQPPLSMIKRRFALRIAAFHSDQHPSGMRFKVCMLPGQAKPSRPSGSFSSAKWSYLDSTGTPFAGEVLGSSMLRTPSFNVAFALLPSTAPGRVTERKISFAHRSQ